MNRLIFSNGVWTSIVVSSILQDKTNNEDNNFLCGYFKNSLETLNAHNFTFSKLLLNYKHCINFLDYKKSFYFNSKQFKKDLNNVEINEIYLPVNSTTYNRYKILNKIYPLAKFYFYEEGLMSYIKPLIDRKLKQIMAKSVNYYLIYTSAIHDFLQNNCKNVKFTMIDKSAILSVIALANSKISLDVMYQDPNKKYALILPQYYYENKPKKLNKLILQYKEQIEYLINSGYVVLFKEHPKAKSSFYNILLPYFSKEDIILLPVASKYPVEMLMSNMQIDLIFSAYSTSLFTFKYLFNKKTLTSASMLLDRMNIFSIYPYLSCAFTMQFIDNIDCNINKNIVDRKKILYNCYYKLIKYFT